MAARLLRLSSFKGLQADRWGLLRTHSAVSFCTRTEDPTKPGKKKKAAVKTEAPDLRESLLAYKSTVGFPVRTPQPAVLLTHSVGDAESASTSSSFPAVAPSEVESKAAASSSHPVQVLPDGASRPAEDAGAEEVDTAAVPAAATEGALTPESGDPAAGETSSSSDSESDSDSDSDDEKSASTGPATSPEPQQSSAEKEEHSPELPKEQAEVQGGQKVPASSHVAPPADRAVHESSGGSEKLELPKPSSPQTSAEGVEKVANEILEDDAPPVGSAISEASSPSLVQDAAQDKMQTAGPAEHPAEEPAVDIPEASVKCLAETEAVEEPSEPQNLSAQPPEAQSEASSPAGVTEELVDPGQSLKGAGELQLEEAPAPEPEPEEPFDNSTYKNYQHHSYNPYTFADLDLEMAKYRLPQPSSGRPSPRH